MAAMLPKIRFRNLAAHIPLLDRLRLDFLSWFCNHGSAFMGDSYQIIRLFAPGAREHVKEGKPAIFALHHGRMVGLLDILPARHKLTVLVSQSRDGEIIGRAITNLGFTVARGSPGRGAVEGGRQLVKASQSGQYLALMVDGPRGPALSVKAGILRIARMTGLPIIPFVCTARSAWRMWGWDKFMAPCWGGPIIYVYGTPITVPSDASAAENESLRLKLEDELLRLKAVAGNYWKAAGETNLTHLNA